MIKRTIIFFLLVASIGSCYSQNEKPSKQKVGGSCEGCEAIHEYGEKELKAVDTLPLYKNNEPKILLTGTVFQNDGSTPAKNVIVYIYHTNRDGIYQTKGNEAGWARRHGFIRGWVKTGKDGNYSFYTFRPASYPNSQIPEHIHMTVKEPDLNEYYIDDIHFDDDPFLTKSERVNRKNRAGSGIVKPILEDGIYKVKRDIFLGLNIPGYE